MSTMSKFDILVPKFVFFAVQGGRKSLLNYHLVGENCVLVGENIFDLPDLVGENICLRNIYVA